MDKESNRFNPNPMRAGIIEERLPNGRVRVRMGDTGELIEAAYLDMACITGHNTKN